jgi:ATP-dependent helicase HrpB
MEMTDIRGEKSDTSKTGLLLALAYPERVARRRTERSGLYQLSGGTVAALPAGSLLVRDEFLTIADVDVGGAEARIYLAAPVQKNELESVFAAEISSGREIVWSTADSKVRARHLRKLGAVILDEQPLEPEGEKVSRALIEGVRRTGLHCLPWDKETERFRARVQWVRGAAPNMSGLPDLSDEALAASLEHWLTPFVDNMWKLEQLQRLDLLTIVRSLLTPQQMRDLDRLAPSHLQVPSGSRVALDYTQTEHPSLSVKLQELFGLVETPRVAGGTIPVTIHLLSPAARPLAVTQDLRSFWQNVYPEIRKQLRARYPKHPWPENPMTAVPTRRTIKRR